MCDELLNNWTPILHCFNGCVTNVLGFEKYNMVVPVNIGRDVPDFSRDLERNFGLSALSVLFGRDFSVIRSRLNLSVFVGRDCEISQVAT